MSRKCLQENEPLLIKSQSVSMDDSKMDTFDGISSCSSRKSSEGNSSNASARRPLMMMKKKLIRDFSIDEEDPPGIFGLNKERLVLDSLLTSKISLQYAREPVRGNGNVPHINADEQPALIRNNQTRVQHSFDLGKESESFSCLRLYAAFKKIEVVVFESEIFGILIF